MSAIAPPLTSPKPYLIRAWHEWMSDNGLTPHILVMVDATVAVPREYVKNNEVVLNVSSEATGGLSLGNEEIRFQARFAGRVRDITVPIDRVASIFARENGQGMVFEALLPDDAELDEEGDNVSASGAADAGAPTAASRATTPQPQGLTLVGKSESQGAEPKKKQSPQKQDARSGSQAPDDDAPPPSAPKGGGLKVVK